MKKSLSNKSSKKQHSSKKSIKINLRRTSFSKENAYERINLSDDSSSDEPLNTSLISFKNDHSYSCAIDGDNNNKKSLKAPEKHWQKLSPTKYLNKHHSSKKSVDESLRSTSCSKENVYKKTNLCKDSSSGELLNATLISVKNDHLYSCAIDGDNNNKKPLKAPEEHWQESSSTKSLEKTHSSKKNVENSLRCTLSSKEYNYKKINLDEDSSPDGPLNTTFSSCKKNRSYYRVSGEDNNKKSPQKPEEDRQKSSSTKSLKTQHSPKESIKITLRRTSISKGNAYKGINVGEDSFSDKFFITTSYSRASSTENRHKKAPKKLEKDRHRLPSAKSLEKQHSSLINFEETSLRTRRSVRNAYKRIDYCEASSSDELENSNTSKVQGDSLYSSIGGSESRYKEAHNSLKLRSGKNKTSKNNQRIPDLKDNSSDDSYDFSVEFYRDLITKDSDLLKFDAKRNDLLEADNATSAPETLSNKTDLSEKATPFRYWGKGASKANETLRQSEGVQDDSIFSSVAGSECRYKETHHSLKLLSGKNKTTKNSQRIPDLKESSSDDSDVDILGSKDDSSVDFNLDSSKKYSDLSEFGTKGNDLLEADNATSALETLSNKTDLSENATPFRYWGKGASKANETLKQSEGSEKHKKKDASVEFVPTPKKHYDPKKDWEKFRALATLRKQLENKKELSKSKTDADIKTT